MLEGCLSSRNLFRSVNLDDAVQRCSQLLWPHRMGIVQRGRKDIETVVDGIVHNELSLIYVKHGADVIIDAGEPDNYYLVQYNMSGHGSIKSGKKIVNISPKSVSILSPGMHSLMEYDYETVQLGVRLKRQTVESYLEDLMLSPISQPLIFDLKMQPDSAAVKSWEHTLEYLVSQYNVHFENQKTPGWDTAFAKMVIDLLLRLQSHNYSSKLNVDRGICCPTYIRRAQEYIHEKCEEQISMADLSTITGVTSRTLQNSFRKYLGRAPMDYIRSVKLQRIHRELKRANTDMSVSDIIVKYSIYNFGRFAQRYKKRYGCLPSETLKERYK